MSDDDVDIYNDLPVLNLEESIAKIEEEREQLKLQLVKTESDLKSTLERILHLENENKTLEKNISALYNTAVNEIKSKDRVIENLRREKDSIIFRRKRKQNVSTAEVLVDESRTVPENTGNISWPRKLIPVTLNEESTREDASYSEAYFSNKSSAQSLEKKNHYNFHSDNFSPSLVTDESRLQVINVGVLDCREEALSHQKLDVGLQNSTTLDTSHSNLDVTTDKLPFCSSHALEYDSDRRSGSSGQSTRNDYSKNRREKKSLSQGRREGSYKPNESQEYFSPVARHRSPYRRNSLLKFRNERSRREENLRDINFQRHSYKDPYKHSKKFSTDTNDRCRDKCHFTSENNLSAKCPRRSNSFSKQRYSDRESFRSIVSRHTKPQSDNVRVASQVKSKYSRTMRERSVSSSPGKLKLIQSGLKGSKLQGECRVPIKKLALEESEACIQEISANYFGKNDECSNKNTQREYVNLTASREYQKCKNDCTKQKRCKESDLLVHSKSNICASDSDNSCSVNSIDNPSKRDCVYENSVSESSTDIKRTENKIDGLPSRISCMSDKNKDESINPISDNDMRFHSRVTEKSRCASKEDNIKKQETQEFNSVEKEDVFLPKSQSSSELRTSNQTENRRKSYPNIDENSLKDPKAKENHIFSSTNILTTPPSKYLIPLKVSPSFEDPAVVNENKFSFCVFNEQCDFKRRKRKLSVKLIISPKTTNIPKNNTAGLNNALSAQTGNICAMKNDVCSDIVDSISGFNACDNSSHEQLQSVEIKEDKLIQRNSNKAMLNSPANARKSSKQISSTTDDVRVNKDASSSSTKHNTVNLFYDSPSTQEIQSKESPVKRRKLDSICEELKANLVKRNSVTGVEDTPRHSKVGGVSVDTNDSSVGTPVSHSHKCSTAISESANTGPPVKRTVVSRLRKRVFNLQDSVVQVLSQVKSQISP